MSSKERLVTSSEGLEIVSQKKLPGGLGAGFPERAGWVPKVKQNGQKPIDVPHAAEGMYRGKALEELYEGAAHWDK